MGKLIFAKNINNVEISGIVDLSTNPPKVYCLVEDESIAYEILNNISNIEAYKNRIRVLSNLNEKYRERLGMSNEPMDLDLLIPLA